MTSPFIESVTSWKGWNVEGDQTSPVEKKERVGRSVGQSLVLILSLASSLCTISW